jgi:guanylate cyclase
VKTGSHHNPNVYCFAENKDYTGRVAIVAGWGRTEERKPTSSSLRKVAVPILSSEECLKYGYSKSRITENMICAGYADGKKDACQVRAERM